ncbi:P-loop containing nucleoside triphosphate hydrolase protein [Pilobolus umbonatus]|nr:P-loop containing nucleoside triphosphate hydrolase protein [Pilobolus umbonatus]
MQRMKRSFDVEVEEEISFDSLIKNKDLLNGLAHCGYDKPSPIQLRAIPLGRLGIDLIAQAKSGTGKTVVFGVIILEAINVNNKHPQALIVVPTREIAIQIRDVIRHIGQCIRGLKCEAVIGGLSGLEDTQKIAGSQVIVATPGRLMALMNEKRIITRHISLFVLDEADKMMSTTFLPQIQFINSQLPANKQCISFSATFNDDLLDSLSKFMKTPKTIRLIQGVPTLNEVQQYYSQVKVEGDVSQTQIYRAKFEAAADILGKIPFYQCMIFVNSLTRYCSFTS